jgi:IMP dehydrogenase
MASRCACAGESEKSKGRSQYTQPGATTGLETNSSFAFDVAQLSRWLQLRLCYLRAMAKTIIQEPSRTLMEYRLLPALTTAECTIAKVSLATRIARKPKAGGAAAFMALKLPLLSAAMQSVSGTRMAIELASLGGAAVLFASQTPADQAAMVRAVKNHRAGFVSPRTLSPDDKLTEVTELTDALGYSTFPVVDTQKKLLGLLTKNDFDPVRHANLSVRDRMVPRTALAVGVAVTDLGKAYELLTESHQSVLPIVDNADTLLAMVFRKDIRAHLDNPDQMLDARERFVVFAAINTHDYRERAKALADAEVDALVIDASDGHSVFQGEAIRFVKAQHPNLPLIAGNVITGDGFAEAGADAVKVGMGGGSICITQEQKGTGRGLATAIIDVVRARDSHFEKTGTYLPIIADGGIETARDITMALAMGADACMMGRFFARMDESPTEKVMVNNRVMKPYWGEGSSRARSWREQRYGQGSFVEGVEGLVEYAGKLRDNVAETTAKIRASMSSCGSASIAAFHQNAVLELVSALSIREGQVHDIYMPKHESSETS